MKNRIRHTAGVNDTAIPHFKTQITEITLEKKLNTVSPHFPLHAVEERGDRKFGLNKISTLYLMFRIFVNIIMATSFHLSVLVC